MYLVVCLQSLSLKFTDEAGPHLSFLKKLNWTCYLAGIQT